jgi:hypothetical protein
MLLSVILLLLVATLHVATLPTPTCQLVDFSLGKWERIDNTPGNKSFVCCSKDAMKHPEVEAACSVLPKATERDCNCDSKGNTFTTISERERWMWKPDGCSLLTWNVETFCKYLGNKTILFTGDSTVGQIFISVKGMLGNASCNNQMLRERLTKYSVEKNSTFFSSVVKYPQADYVIMNLGPWYDDPAEFIRAILSTARDIEKLKKLPIYKKTKFLWKTTSPAHHSCTDFHAPISSPLPLNHTDDKYYWDWFPLYDEISVRELLPIVDNIFNMFPLYLRADAHVGFYSPVEGSDCLHFCLPGPLNLFSVMLLHYLHHETPQRSNKRDKHKYHNSTIPCYSSPIYFRTGRCIHNHLMYGHRGRTLPNLPFNTHDKDTEN